MTSLTTTIYGAPPEVQLVPVGTLRPAPWNPRTITDERFQNLCRSLEADPEFLWRRPILATAAGDVLAGNMRLRAVLHLGWAEVPAIVDDVSEQLAKERALRDNGQWGEWEDQDLAALLRDLAENASDVTLLGFDGRELNHLLALSAPARRTDPDDIPAVPEEPISRLGDLWALGDHRLLCGDSTEPEALTRLLGAERAACVWTDPPYGVDYVGRTRDAMTILSDGREGLPALLRDAFAAMDGVMVPGCPFYVAHPAGSLSIVFGRAVEGVGWHLHETLVWVKDSMVLGHSDYHYKHEPILYGWKLGAQRPWLADRKEVSVFEVPRPKRSAEHPTTKPVELVTRMVRNSTGLNAVVLDPFLGSGTTLVACEDLGRRCYGVELDPRYADVAVRRWEAYTGKVAVKL